MISTATEELAEILLLCNALYGSTVGKAHISVGIEPHLNTAGKYTHKSLIPTVFEWPSEAEQFAREIQRESSTADVYLCPYLMHGGKRAKGAAVERRIVHCDYDGDIDLGRVRELGGFAVASGTPGHAQVYISLTDPVTAAHHEILCKALGGYLGGDADSKISDNDLMRPTGTWNHKPTVDGREPAAVEWLIRPEGQRIEPEALAKLLGAHIGPSQAAGATNGQTGSNHTIDGLEPFTTELFPKVVAALANPKTKGDGSTERSATIAAVIGACYDSHLTLANARWVIDADEVLRSKVEERRAKGHDEVLTVWLKIQNSRQDELRNQNWFSAEDGDEGTTSAEGNGGSRVLTLHRVSDISDDIPDWVWEHGNQGRIQRGVLTIFAGRPGAGKSTAARWFAARASRGELEGMWNGKPQNVAYIATEESARYVIKPGLRAAGADMSRIFIPTVEFNGQATGLLAEDDEKDLTEQLLDAGITWLFLDPMMSTIKTKTDIYRNNEMRQSLAPWNRIAEAINGAVIGIAHLNKGQNGDVVAALNGSSAIGEVARCVFGFAKDPESDEGDRVMSQVKNSCGREDLSLNYVIRSEMVRTDSRRSGVMPLFEITGDSDTNVSEILTPSSGRKDAGVLQPVLDYVNSRDVTTAEDVVRAKLARDNKKASQQLSRLCKRHLIDKTAHGCYSPRGRAQGKGGGGK